MKSILASVLFIGLIALGSPLASTCSAANRPNIIFIVADDLGYGELGCYGGRDVPTPHMDSLARNGVRFTSGYVTAPYCAASRAALLTGRYQTRFGFEFNPIGAANSDPAIGLLANGLASSVSPKRLENTSRSRQHQLATL